MEATETSHPRTWTFNQQRLAILWKTLRDNIEENTLMISFPTNTLRFGKADTARTFSTQMGQTTEVEYCMWISKILPADVLRFCGCILLASEEKLNGLTISGFTAEAVTQRLEMKTILLNIKPKLWLNYVDDTFIVIKWSELRRSDTLGTMVHRYNRGDDDRLQSKPHGGLCATWD